MQFLYDGHTYEIVKSAASWQQAQRYAKMEGGSLAQIESRAENDVIFGHLIKASRAWGHHYTADDGGGAEYVWLGGTDLHKEGQWRWSDGSGLQFQNWGYGGEPDNYHNQDC